MSIRVCGPPREDKRRLVRDRFVEHRLVTLTGWDSAPNEGSAR